MLSSNEHEKNFVTVICIRYESVFQTWFLVQVYVLEDLRGGWKINSTGSS